MFFCDGFANCYLSVGHVAARLVYTIDIDVVMFMEILQSANCANIYREVIVC